MTVTKEWLLRMYWEEEYSVRAIAAMADLNYRQARMLMKKHGISLRSRTEARNTRRCQELSHKAMAGRNNPQYGKRGALSTNWKNGRRISSNEYIYIHKPDHPYANSDGYVSEHVLVWVDYWKTDIPKDCMIHHIDENRQNNKIENLMLVDHRIHTNIHKRPISKKTRQKMSASHKEAWKRRER